MSAMLGTAAYNQLRTKEQLGYIVFFLANNWENVSMLRVGVQSESKLPHQVQDRIEDFFATTAAV